MSSVEAEDAVPVMTTHTFVPKSELFDWLRGSVRRRENTALKIVTETPQDAAHRSSTSSSVRDRAQHTRT